MHVISHAATWSLLRVTFATGVADSGTLLERRSAGSWLPPADVFAVWLGVGGRELRALHIRVDPQQSSPLNFEEPA
jgi:hypothetical protein